MPAGIADTLTVAALFDWPLSAHGYVSFDAVLDIDDARGQYLSQFLSHVRVFDGLRERRQHLFGELTGIVGRYRSPVWYVDDGYDMDGDSS